MPFSGLGSAPMLRCTVTEILRFPDLTCAASQARQDAWFRCSRRRGLPEGESVEKSGGGGIRTHGSFHFAGFQDRSHQPLDHPSRDDLGSWSFFHDPAQSTHLSREMIETGWHGWFRAQRPCGRLMDGRSFHQLAGCAYPRAGRHDRDPAGQPQPGSSIRALLRAVGAGRYFSGSALVDCARVEVQASKPKLWRLRPPMS